MPGLLTEARQRFQHLIGEDDVLRAFPVAPLSAKDELSSSRPAVQVAGLSPAAIYSDQWLQQDARFATLSASHIQINDGK
jgi:hypothetical protein